MSKFVEYFVTDILEPHQGNAIYTKKNVISQNWGGDIPVISSDVKNSGILCYISKEKLYNSKDLVDYPCITWTVDGVAGKLTYRDYPFVPNNHCGWLKPLVQFLDFNYLVLAMQNSFFDCAKNSSNKKVGNNQISKLKVSIPVNEDGTFDTEEQQRLVFIYNDIEDKKNKLLKRISELEELMIHIDNESDIEYKDLPLNKIVDHINGDAKYTKQWCKDNKGDFPVYSANNNEPISYINHYDYDGEYLTYSKNGCAGYISIINGKFSVNGDRCVMPKKEEFKDIVDLMYLKYYLEPIFRTNKKGRLGDLGKNEFTKLNSTMIKKLNIQVPIPITSDGSFDLEKQKEIANKYRQIDEIKQGLIDKIKSLVEIKVVQCE